MKEIIWKCYIDLYRASEDKNGDPGDFVKLYEEYGRDNFPYNNYYIPESKMIRIVKEYLEKITNPDDKVVFVDAICTGLAPSTKHI